MMNNKILIGITSKNRVNILPKAIESGLQQDYAFKEIAVFDDNSTDGTEQLCSVYPQVTWHLSQTEKGYVYARNMFLETTDAEFYCSLDDDSWFLSNDKLNDAVQYMNTNPEVAVLAFRILSRDPKRVEDDAIRQVNNFIGCGHMLRIRTVNEAGNYAYNPGYYGVEEKDLCIRLIDMGQSIVKYPLIEIWHDKTTVARNAILQHRSGVCNDFVFMWRRTPLLYLIPSVFAKLYVHFTFPIRYKNAALYKPMIKGIGDFISVLIKGKIKRQPVTIKGFRKYLSFNK